MYRVPADRHSNRSRISTQITVNKGQVCFLYAPSLKLFCQVFKGIGILGHYHVQQNKVDPGPAFQWDRVVDGANELLSKTTN